MYLNPNRPKRKLREKPFLALSPLRMIFKGKVIHYPSKQVRDAQVSGAVNMLEHLSHITSKLALQAVDMSNRINQMVEIDRTDDDNGSMTSHNQQNN